MPDHSQVQDVVNQENRIVQNHFASVADVKPNPLDRDQTQECGLMFMCINANTERQFEFVQQTWINSPSFNGLYDERDPMLGSSSSQKTGTMTIPRQPVRRRLSGLGSFVTVRGGAYFFLPSIKALRYLATWR